MARRGGDKTTLDATTPSPFDRSIGPQCKVIHVHGARAVKDRQNVHHRPFTRRSGPEEERKFSTGSKMNCLLPVARLTIKVTYTCHVEKCLYVARHVHVLSNGETSITLPSAQPRTFVNPVRKIFERTVRFSWSRRFPNSLRRDEEEWIKIKKEKRKRGIDISCIFRRKDESTESAEKLS